MFYARKLQNKFNVYRKRTSAPMLMTIIIIISMFLVFSFEQIGLFRKERNLSSQAIYIGKSKLNLIFVKFINFSSSSNIKKYRKF